MCTHSKVIEVRSDARKTGLIVMDRDDKCTCTNLRFIIYYYAMYRCYSVSDTVY